MPKISIITVSYNNKAGLEKTIGSVLAQTFSDTDFVVIDGDSNDGSKEIITKYKDKIGYAISEPDSGIYEAMNKGIRAAKGEYVIFMNSADCFLDENTLTNAAARMDGNLDIYYGDQVYYNEKKRLLMDWIFPEKLTLGFFIDASLPHQATFIKKALFESVSYYNENLKIVSDWEFFVRALCLHNASYKHLGIKISEYDTGGISSDARNHALVYQERERTYEKYFPMIIDEYKSLKALESRRVKNMLYIRQFGIPWKLLKGFTNLLLIFLPKRNEQKNYHHYGKLQ